MRKEILKLMAIPLMIMLLASSTMALTATTDKEVYYPGDTIVVRGMATPSAIVSFTVFNPSNGLLTVDQVKAADDGSFEKAIMTFPEAPTDLMPYGDYTIIVKDTSTNEELELQVAFEQPQATIQGTVTTTEGSPIEDAVVTIKLGTVTVAVTSTDENGAFSATVTETGTYTIEVTASGYEMVTTEAEVTELPQTVNVNISLEEERLTVEIESITADGKPMFGVAREGSILTVTAKAYFGPDEVTTATLTGYLTSSVREAAGMPPMEFELTYDEHSDAYVGTVQLPSPGVDRLCLLTVEAEYQGMTAQDQTNFITLVNTPKDLKDLSDKIGNVTEEVLSLNDTLSDLQKQLEELQKNLNSLNSTVSTLQSTVKSLQDLQKDVSKLQTDIKNLAKSEDVNNLKTDLQNLQTKINEVSGSKGLAQGAIAVGIIAILIALGSLAYINKKIQG